MIAKLKEFLAVWPKVLRLLRYSSMRLSLIVFVLTALEAFISIGVLYIIKLLIDVISVQFAEESVPIRVRSFCIWGSRALAFWRP